MAQQLPFDLIHFPFGNQAEYNFIGKLKSYHGQVKMYYDGNVRASVAKAVTPDLFGRWREQRKLNNGHAIKDFDSCNCFLVELVDWFKNEFFTWFNEPTCSNCSDGTMERDHMKELLGPTKEESIWNASRVEVYKCKTCTNSVRFPRYNNPVKLLETRQGRCGEWANCMACICTALGFETRLVLDWTDHVWLEIYSELTDRWVHCDPCENVFDAPLMYECGWNKQLTYCIAFTANEIQDVTWRYTMKPKEVLFRRRECREDFLTRSLITINSNLQNKLNPVSKNRIIHRQLIELVQFIYTPNGSTQLGNITDAELQGRQSGSLNWRHQRGELGINSNIVQNVKYCFQARNESGVFKLTYNCAKNEYKFNGQTLSGWHNGMNSYQNLTLKKEHDWKMIYLSRMEGTTGNQSGFAIWVFNINQSAWKDIRIKVNCQTFETGKVKLTVIPDNDDSRIKEIFPNSENIIQSTEMDVNLKQLAVKVELYDGRGPNAWQHAQIFRQSTHKNIDMDGFEFIINYN